MSMCRDANDGGGGGNIGNVRASLLYDKAADLSRQCVCRYATCIRSFVARVCRLLRHRASNATRHEKRRDEQTSRARGRRDLAT